MKKFYGVIAVMSLSLAIFPLMGCDDTAPTADQKMQAQQEQLQNDADKQAGLPRIVNFQELKNLNWTYELRDQANLSSWTYKTDMNGRLHFVCNSIGYPFPYGTQRSNPQKIVRMAWGGNYYNFTLPQAEPNGIFPPSTAEGSWVICINPDPKATPKIGPMYVEDRVQTSLWSLHAEDEPKK